MASRSANILTEPKSTLQGLSKEISIHFYQMNEIDLCFVLGSMPPKEEQEFQDYAMLCLPPALCIMLWLLPEMPFPLHLRNTRLSLARH